MLMPPDPITPLPVRASDLERDSIASTLRNWAAEGRLSLDTFERRLERLQQARDREQLGDLLRDLPARGRLTRFLASAVASASALSREIQVAWWRPRVPRLELPRQRDAVTVGRSRSCDYQLGDPFVSRCHATIRRTANGWVIEDHATVNGTRVNGVRIVGPTPIRTGDLITLGPTHIRLA